MPDSVRACECGVMPNSATHSKNSRTCAGVTCCGVTFSPLISRKSVSFDTSRKYASTECFESDFSSLRYSPNCFVTICQPTFEI